jgi:DNA-binding transcriptional LysR family regulator
MLDLRRLRLLKEFAARGTIAATAAALGYTPSAVSQQLAALEREAGVILLDRTARSAELTDAGRRLATRAEHILAQVEEAEAELSATEREPSGRVSVAAFPTAAAAFAPALARSLRAHPALTLLLRQTQRDEGLTAVRSGEADVALVDDWAGRLGRDSGGVLQFYPLVRDPLVLIVPRGHPLANPAEPVDLRKLSETSRWMAAPAGEPSRQATDRLLAAVGGAPAMPWEFEGLGTILSLVSRGIGVAAVPRLALAAGEGRVAVRELPGSGVARDVYAVARTASVRRPSVAVVLAALDHGARHLPDRPHRPRTPASPAAPG